MRSVFLPVMILCLTAFLPFYLDSAEKAPDGKPGTTELFFDWTDRSRSRIVPVKIYLPEDSGGSVPVIILSHGLGGSRDGYRYLGLCWAEHGYVAVHVEHEGSNRTLVSDSMSDTLSDMKTAARDPANAINRPLDIKFVIDKLEEMNTVSGPLQKRLDMKKVGVAGHSFGAYTALAVAGQVFITPAGKEMSLGDPRVKAALIMSAPVQERQKKFGGRAYSKITVPCFHMTGTKDISIIGETSAEDRRFPFDHSANSDQYLITFNGGDHMVFSGVPRRSGEGKNDKFFQHMICKASTAFWDFYLKGHPDSKDYLMNGGLEKELGSSGKFELKQYGTSRK